MVKKNNSIESEVTIFITDELSEDKKTKTKSILKIPGKVESSEMALRVFGKNNENKYYTSTRGSLNKTSVGYECNVTGHEATLIGSRFELTETGTKKIILSGKIAEKKAEATVVESPKTGTMN